MKKTVLTILLCFGIFTISYSQEKEKGQKPPTIMELFKQMDTNKDAKLSKKEVKGPLKDDFDTIDLNKDGFLTKEEIEKAPKPKRKGGKRGNDAQERS